MILGFSNILRNSTPFYYVDLPSFQRDFAALKTLDHGTGPNITFTRASDATYFDANGVLQTASNNVPRFDHDPATGSSLGLLIEESRTNSIRNSQAGGAVAGTAGTGPTNWVVSGSINGLTRTISLGTLNGLTYIEARFAGTATANAQVFYDPEASNVISASAGQTWTHSAYVALVGGNVPDCQLGIREGLADGTFVTSGQTNIASSLTSSLQRFSHTRTLTDATTARVAAIIRVTITNGVAYDFTLRIAAPQLEQGAFPTSYIPTTTAAVPRSADLALVNSISSFYNQTEGTLFAEWSAAGLPDVPSINIDNTTQNERIMLLLNANSIPQFFVGSSNTTQASFPIGSAVTIGQVVKAAGAAKANDFIAAVGGTLSANDTSGVMPSVTRLSIGQRANNATGNGHIRKVAYWPKRLSNTLLQQLTT